MKHKQFKINLMTCLIVVGTIFSPLALAAKNCEFTFDCKPSSGDTDKYRGAWMMCAIIGFKGGACPKVRTDCFKPPLIKITTSGVKSKCLSPPSKKVATDKIQRGLDYGASLADDQEDDDVSAGSRAVDAAAIEYASQLTETALGASGVFDPCGPASSPETCSNFLAAQNIAPSDVAYADLEAAIEEAIAAGNLELAAELREQLAILIALRNPPPPRPVIDEGFDEPRRPVISPGMRLP
jgi:hypothetical protein